MKDLLAGVGLGKSSHYYQVGAIAAGDKDAELREQARAVFDASDEAQGRRRVHDELAAGGSPAGERRIAGIMREGRLVARGRKRRRGYSPCRGGDIPAPRQQGGARLPRGSAQLPVAHRRHAVRHPRGQGLPQPRARLLRRDDSQLDCLDQPQRRDGQLDAEGRARDGAGPPEAVSRASLGFRLPLPLAGVDIDLRGARHHALDVG